MHTHSTLSKVAICLITCMLSLAAVAGERQEADERAHERAVRAVGKRVEAPRVAVTMQ